MHVSNKLNSIDPNDGLTYRLSHMQKHTHTHMQTQAHAYIISFANNGEALKLRHVFLSMLSDRNSKKKL